MEYSKVEPKTNKKILTLLGLGHAVTDLNQGALSIILAYLQPVFSLSQLQVGLTMMAFNLSSSVIQPAFGVLSDRLRAAWLIPLGCLFAGLGMTLAGYSPSYHFLLLAVLLSGLGVAAYHPEGSKFARFASGPQKASGMALFSVGGNLGFAAGPLLAVLFYNLAGRGGSAGFLALNGAMALVLWLLLPSIIRTQEGIPAEHLTTDENTLQKTENSTPQRVVIPIVLLVLVVVMRSWIHLGLTTFMPQYYIHHLHRSEAYAATLSSIFLFAGAAGTLVGGPAADRWGLKNVIVGSMAVLVPLVYAFTHVGGILTVLVVALAGFAAISTFAVTVVFGQELLPNNVGLASGLMLGFAIGTGGIGATLLGWVADTWGLPAVFSVLVMFSAIGLTLALLLPPVKSKSSTPL